MTDQQWFFNKRNNFIKNLALDLKGNTLILFARVEGHGEPLYNLINTNSIINRHVFFVHGGVATEDREKIRKSLKVRIMRLSLHPTGRFPLALTLRTCIM